MEFFKWVSKISLFITNIYLRGIEWPFSFSRNLALLY